MARFGIEDLHRMHALNINVIMLQDAMMNTQEDYNENTLQFLIGCDAGIEVIGRQRELAARMHQQHADVLALGMELSALSKKMSGVLDEET